MMEALMGRQNSVLIVESRENVMDILRFNLQRTGYDVLKAYDGETALRSFRAKKPNLVLLDALLSGEMNGFEVCEAVQKTDQDTAIMMMVAQDETEDAQWAGLNKENYIVKPFSMWELLAKIKAALISVEQSDEPPSAADEAVTIVGELSINKDAQQVFLARQAVYLTAQEYDLLAFLIDHPNKVYSRLELIKQIRDYGYMREHDRSVDVVIRRLREKIEADPSHPVYILTRRGAGYFFSIKPG